MQEIFCCSADMQIEHGLSHYVFKMIPPFVPIPQCEECRRLT